MPLGNNDGRDVLVGSSVGDNDVPTVGPRVGTDDGAIEGR